MLFDRFSARSLHLSNRLVMAPNPSMGAPLNVPDMATFCVPGARGHTDYPALAA